MSLVLARNCGGSRIARARAAALTLWLGLVLMGGGAQAAFPQGTITIAAGASPTAQAAAGTSLAVPLLMDMSAAGGVSMSTFVTGLAWPALRLSFDSLKTGTFGSLSADLAGVAAGNLTLTAFNAAGNAGSTTIATAYFTALANPGGARVQLAPTNAHDVSGENLLSLLQLRALDVCVLTQGKWGDASGDGTINIIDAQQLARFSVALSVANPTAAQAFGDVNADNAVNIIDAQQVARYSVGLSAAARVNTVVNVTPSVATVAMTPTSAAVNVGAALQLSATPMDAGGASIAGCFAVIYTSGDPSRATVSATGVVTGVAPGTVTITGSAGGVSGASSVTVNATAAAVASVQVSPSSGSVNVGGSIQFGATPRDAGGNPLSGRVVTWSSASPAIAAVNGSGLVTGAAAGGPVTITATSEGVSGTATLNVTAPSGGLGLLRVSAVNPRYFVDGNGAPVYLAGSHTWNDFQDVGIGDPPPAFDYPAFLDYLVARGHNLTKFWSFENERWSQDLPGDEFRSTPTAYLRTGPGLALDGKPKFDLTRYNPVYFDRLRQRLIAAGQRGIYVAVMLFEGESIEPNYNRSPTNPWLGHPYHRANNINGIDGDPNFDDNGLETHRLQIAAVTARQQAYIRQVVDVVNDLDNVLFEISLEDRAGAEGWQNAMIQYVKQYEATKPKQHPVGMTSLFPGGQNSDLYASAADWISPNGTTDDTPAANGSKVILQDTDHLCGTCTDPKWVWKNLTRGVNTWLMDPYDGSLPYAVAGDQRSTPEWEVTRRTMGYALTLARRLNLLAMTPRDDLASTGYCLANPSAQNGEYVVYLPNGGAANVDLSGTPGTLSYEWIVPSSGQVILAGTITGGGVRTFDSSFLQSDAVLYIHR